MKNGGEVMSKEQFSRLMKHIYSQNQGESITPKEIKPKEIHTSYITVQLSKNPKLRSEEHVREKATHQAQ